MQAKLHPALLRGRPSVPGLSRLREAQMCRRKRTIGHVPGFPLVLGWKAGQLIFILKHFWPLSASLSWHFCSNFSMGMHLLSIVLTEFHSLSIIRFMMDLFNFFPFLTSLWLLFYCWLKLHCKPCSAKYRLTVKWLGRQDVMGIIPNCYSVGGLSIKCSWTISSPWWIQLLVEVLKSLLFEVCLAAGNWEKVCILMMFRPRIVVLMFFRRQKDTWWGEEE